jgi:hypothetical protein
MEINFILNLQKGDYRILPRKWERESIGRMMKIFTSQKSIAEGSGVYT